MIGDIAASRCGSKGFPNGLSVNDEDEILRIDCFPVKKTVGMMMYSIYLVYQSQMKVYRDSLLKME